MALELLRRRVVLIALFTWGPLLLLSAIEGGASGGSMKIPFLYDIEAHVRFLVALPALVIAELVVHKRVSPLVRRFVERRIIAPEDLPTFNAAVKSTLRVRNSIVMEVALLILVYTLGLWVWRNQVALGSPTWYAQPDQTGLHFTLAGYWYAFVSIPIFQFILLRWYMRLLLWFRLLWRISRLNLRLTGAHPDRAGGIGFLGKSSYAFGPILFAQGALLSGLIASRVLYEGQSLTSFKMEAGGLIAGMVLFILGLKVYPLSQAASPPDTVFVDAIDVVFDATIPYDIRFFQSLDRMVQYEPWLERDRAMIDLLSPSASKKARLSTLTRRPRKYSATPSPKLTPTSSRVTTNVFEPPFDKTASWALPALKELAESLPANYVQPDSYPTDARSLAYSYAFFSAKHLGDGQFYLITIKDKEGNGFDGANR